jgi:predicted RNA-binding Zn-ribbon protein involved in translation (DUF1610 family)
MADYDLFDLTGLPFDPPERAAKKVTAAIDRVKKELGGALGAATQQLERDEINEKLIFLDASSSGIFSNDGKLTQAYDELAEAKIKQEIEKLTAAVSLLKQSGSRTITNGTIRIHRQKTKLSKENVEDVFRNAGFTITEIDPLKAMPKFPTNADKTYNELEALRKSKDPNPNGADLTLATDLYAFAAYLAGEPENAAAYRNKSTPELAGLLDGFAKKFANLNDNLGKLRASLATAGKTYVFNSEDNRHAYEAYLKYKTPSLTRLFSSMRRVSKADLLDPKFAEECIKQISAIFGNYDVSLAIYNKEAGLKDEPYIPAKAVFHVKCHHCLNLSEFDDVTEAQRVNKCTHCGKPLYKRCKKCHKNVLVSLDKCPECAFVFANAAMFAKYFADAEQALLISDFESARGFLFKAQSADPSEKIRTDELAARIYFANAMKLPPSKQADECLAILQYCVDFKPAISFLQSTPPEPCGNFSAGLDSSAGHVNISWSCSSEQGVSYRLIRKQGKEIPANEMDGEVLADNTKDTAYRDKTIAPGQWYSYAVFAVRYGVFSSVAGKTIVLLADVTDVHAEQMNTTVRLTWNAPKNSTGVTIRRTEGGRETVLTNNAHGSFEDAGVRYGVAYSYKLCANYTDLSSSQGVTVVITPMLKIGSFTITAKQLKENTYKVSWNINQKGIDLRVLVDEKQVRTLKSDAGNCDLELPAGGFHTITVLAYSGGNWLRSDNSPQVNTYSPCSIDKASSYFHEDAIVGLQESAYQIELHLKISGVIPPVVAGFYYAVRTGASQNRWSANGEIGVASDIHRIGVAAYQKSGEILHTETAREEEAYYVSLFTIYNMGGKEIVSSPKPCRFDRPLIADLFWKVSKSLLGDLKLSINISGNRPLLRAPELVLCACADNQHLLSHNDPKAARLLSIPAEELRTPQKTYSKSYDVKTDLSVKQLKGTKFFLFETVSVPGENFILRWLKGFIGKI